MRGRRISAKQTEIERLKRMAATGTVSYAEADAALRRAQGFARWWAKRLNLLFANGHRSLERRLMERRVS